MKSSAISHPNIALVKYWGKRDQNLILPYNSSISMTVDTLKTHTTVEFNKKYSEDIFILNREKVKKNTKNYKKYIGRFLEKIREKTGEDLKVKIMSENNFPTAAGLASSASGFSALSAAINDALDLDLAKKELSQLSRQGSGSSTRSIFGGFVKWYKGEEPDGSDSYAEQILNDWSDFRMICCITSRQEKKVKSRAGMAASVSTSPMYSGWLLSIQKDIQEIEKGLQRKDFSLVGEVSERNCLKMHSVMMTTKPSLIYWNDVTIRIIKSIMGWREEGLESYFTIDAGPQVKIICLKKDVDKIQKKCKKIEGVKDIIITKPGQGSRITNKHLF